MKNEDLIESVRDLRDLIGEPLSKLKNKITNQLDEYQKSYVVNSPLIFVSTSDKDGNQEVSPKGDEAGFVKVADSNTLIIPERPGNKLAFGFENILSNGQIGLIFLVPGLTETLRVSGSARLSKSPELLEELSAQGKPALLCTIVTIRKCWLHCGKAFIRSKLWNPEAWSNGLESQYTEQVANAMNVDEDIVKRVVLDDYENNLY